uniref:Uncharacterized protein n=1 Tax=viral metagenome TaxID=1070528 RepID=A0A6M3X5T2_9ZZZZ
MNPNNYASLEASQRLLSSGIVLKTEVRWYRYKGIWSEHSYPYKTIEEISIPRPSMAEAWRELPDSIDGTFEDQMADTYELMIGKTGGIAYAGYFAHEQFENTNPTDALIDLLIHIRKEAT